MRKFRNKTMFAEGRNQSQFEDDTSYINHYLSADADVELTERLSLLTAFHFEHNIWTSSLAGDERNGAHENIYQGEVILAYRLTDSLQGFGGVQRSSCKESFGSSSIKNTNVGIGLRTILKKLQPSPRDSPARLAGRARHLELRTSGLDSSSVLPAPPVFRQICANDYGLSALH